MLRRNINAFVVTLKSSGATWITFRGTGVEAGDTVKIVDSTDGGMWRSDPIKAKSIISIGGGQQLVSAKMKKVRKVALIAEPQQQAAEEQQNAQNGEDPQMQQGDPEGTEVEVTVEDGSGGSGSSDPEPGYAVIDPE